MKSDKLREKAEEAEELEELLSLAVNAEMIIDDLLHALSSVNIQEPHGWLSSIISELVTDIENKLEEL